MNTSLQHFIESRRRRVGKMRDSLKRFVVIHTFPLPDEPISDGTEDEISDKGSLVTEIWCGNPETLKLFENLGWTPAGVDYHRMWMDSKAPSEWTDGGIAQKGVFAVFDAATG